MKAFYTAIHDHKNGNFKNKLLNITDAGNTKIKKTNKYFTLQNNSLILFLVCFNVAFKDRFY